MHGERDGLEYVAGGVLARVAAPAHEHVVPVGAIKLTEEHGFVLGVGVYV